MPELKKDWRHYVLNFSDYVIHIEKVVKVQNEHAIDLCYVFNHCVSPRTDCEKCILTSKTSRKLKEQLDAKGYSRKGAIESIEILQVLGG
jgi:queuine/archaeosine tRNA-ribosyltransferase